MKPYKKIYCCGDCIHYSWKKHKCLFGCKEEDSNPHYPFFKDCPLPSGEEPSKAIEHTTYKAREGEE